MKQQESFYRQGINPGKTHEIHLPFSCKRWTSTKIIRLKLSGNFNFTQACRYDIKLNEPSKKKVGLPCSEETFKGYEDIMIFCAFIFIFCLEPTVKKQPMTTTSVTIMVFFLKKPSWNYLITAMLKVLSQILGGTLNNGIWNDTFQLKILQAWISIGTNYFLSKFLETTFGKSAWKIVYTIIRDCSSKNIALRHFTYYCMLLFLSNRPSF